MYREIYINQLKPGEDFILYESSNLVVKNRNFKGKIGLVLFGAGVFGLIISISPMIVIEANYRLFVNKQPAIDIPNINKNNTPLQKSLSQKDFKNFNLIIPKLQVNSPVIANINPLDQQEYDSALQSGVAQALGSSLPGQGGPIYIFGHSSNYLWDKGKYKAVFYLLKNLEKNDKILLTLNDKVYIYQVTKKDIVESSDLTLLKSGSEEELILQTCWPPQTNWKRLVVTAIPLDEIQQTLTVQNHFSDGFKEISL